MSRRLNYVRRKAIFFVVAKKHTHACMHAHTHTQEGYRMRARPNTQPLGAPL